MIPNYLLSRGVVHFKFVLEEINMIFGYNMPRPRKETYDLFFGKFISGIEGLDIPGLSLMVYGSSVRGDANYGLSDIDATFIFPDDVIIDKDNLEKVALVLSDSLNRHYIPFQGSVNDIATLRDGRFNTYESHFEESFMDPDTIVVGEDYREQINYELPTMENQTNVRFNLRKARIGLLYAEHERKGNREKYEKFLERFGKTTDGVTRAAAQIVYFLEGDLIKNRFGGIDIIKQILPEVDTEPLERIRFLYKNLDQLDILYLRPEEIMPLWKDSVTTFEQMIRGYINLVPREI